MAVKKKLFSRRKKQNKSQFVFFWGEKKMKRNVFFWGEKKMNRKRIFILRWHFSSSFLPPRPV
jgi:hypothetical protein